MTTPTSTSLEKEEFISAWEALDQTQGEISEDIALLFERLWKDMVLNAHSCETKYRHSHAKDSLLEMGRKALRGLARYLSICKNPHSKRGDDLNFDLFYAGVRLAIGIAEAHGLGPKPYGDKVAFGEMDEQVWIDFCLSYTE